MFVQHFLTNGQNSLSTYRWKELKRAKARRINAGAKLPSELMKRIREEQTIHKTVELQKSKPFLKVFPTFSSMKLEFHNGISMYSIEAHVLIAEAISEGSNPSDMDRLQRHSKL